MNSEHSSGAAPSNELCSSQSNGDQEIVTLARIPSRKLPYISSMYKSLPSHTVHENPDGKCMPQIVHMQKQCSSV